MKFPVTIRHRSAKVKIYGPAKKFAYYRLAYTAAGQRKRQTFATYSAAREAALRIAKEIATGSDASALSGGQARDALTALERLDAFRQATGQRLSLNAVVAEYIEAATHLGKDASLVTAVKGYLNNVATVTHKEIAEAVQEFVADRQTKTKSINGRRPELSSHYAHIVGLWLGWFAKMFPGTGVCDLTREHLDLYMGAHSHLAPKSRNHLRNTVKMFLRWCVRKDYLSATHRLFEASGMKSETLTQEDTDFYRPAELRALLDGADSATRPIIALQALAGLRQAEALRLTWQDVFGVAGHVAISATKSKTRSRRLVEMVPALTAWLEPYRQQEGPLWAQSEDTYQETFAALREALNIPARRNGLRHGFVTAHFALHQNENATAAQAGNSPKLVHSNYKGLMTRQDGEAWFAVAPAPAADNIVPISKGTAA